MPAVQLTNIAAVTGIKLTKGNFNPNSPYLPHSISILAEANTANQSGLSTDKLQITSAVQAAEAYGYGSPMHLIARVLFPVSGPAVSVPVYCHAQAEASGAVAKVITITPSGSATAAGTIYVRVAGRNIVDGESYAVSIASGDTVTQQCDKMRAAIAGVLACPVTGSGTTTFVCTAKWAGLTSNDIKITIDTNGYDVGATYSVANTTAGSGTPAVTAAITSFGQEWRTLLINSYGLVSATMLELEAANGIPDDTNPTGRFDTIAWRPFGALSGTLLDDPTSLTDASARKTNCTIWTCPAPLSQGLGFEAAANYAYAIVNTFQSTPNGSVLNLRLPDMPLPLEGVIPAMTSYTTRDAYVKKGCSTVDVVDGYYVIKDFVTTYHPTGEIVPHYRYPRDLNIYSNWVYGYRIRENEVLVGKQIANDDDIVTVSNVVTPNSWKTEVFDLIDGWVRNGLMVDAAFAKSSVAVAISTNNPNRTDTEFNGKIPGAVYISSTTIKGGFNYGSTN